MSWEGAVEAASQEQNLMTLFSAHQAGKMTYDNINGIKVNLIRDKNSQVIKDKKLYRKNTCKF